MGNHMAAGPSRIQIYASLATLAVVFALASCAVSSDTVSGTEGEEALPPQGVGQPQQLVEPVAPAIGTGEELPRSVVDPEMMSERDRTRAGHASSLAEPESSVSRAGGFVWGSLDASRVAHHSVVLETGDFLDDLRAQITGAGDLVVAGATTIDAAYLSGIDVLFISYPSNPGASGAERTALHAWVASGGRLIVAAEEASAVAAQTYTVPFGFAGWTVASAINGTRPALSTHPLVTGVTDIAFFTATATFQSPADGVLLAVHPNARPLIAVQDQDTGFSYPGCVLTFGDIHTLADGTITSADNLQLAANIMSWVNHCGTARVTINEIRADQPNIDLDEYLEIAGLAGTDLSGLTLLAIGDGAGNSGTIENVTNLTGQTIPPSGYFVMAESTYTLGVADFTTTLGFENSDNVTFLLVAGFTGSNGDDVDTDDDCVMDVTPWDYIVDEVASVETPGGGDCIYSAVTVGPDATNAPFHVYRCPDSNGTFVVADVAINASDTPGAANAPCSVNGNVCMVDGDCASGHCVDMLCCDAPCGGNGFDDCQACSAAETGVADGTCAPVLVDTVCRAAAGDCDVEETCNGTDLTCPADAVANPGDPCGDSTDDECTDPDVCDDAGVCQSHNELPGTSCGDSTDDECTDPDTCDDAGVCQSNDEAPGTSCGDSTDDECANPDSCDDAGVCQGNDEPVGTNCGDAGTECTNQDTCDGAGACTDQGFQPAATACGDNTDDECTNPDSCDGAGTCESNHEANGFSCGDAGTDCVNQDTCDGAGICSDNGFQTAGTACGDSTDDECTAPDTCDAVGGCLDNHQAAGTACGDQGVDCNVDDECDGSGVCTDNGVEAAGTACGDSADHDCTDPDTCDDAGSCQSNDVASGTVCRAAAGDCDAEEVCDGAGSECPSDQVTAAGTVCRAAAGECDAEEACDGAGSECPSDSYAAAGTVCRAASGECDAEEVCDGAASDCPTDGSAADGTSCDDGDSCTGGDACSAGSCEAGSEDLCSAPPPSGLEDTNAEGGCGCRVVAPRQGQGHRGWLWLALGVPILRRRWRRAAV